MERAEPELHARGIGQRGHARTSQRTRRGGIQAEHFVIERQGLVQIVSGVDIVQHAQHWANRWRIGRSCAGLCEGDARQQERWNNPHNPPHDGVILSCFELSRFGSGGILGGIGGDQLPQQIGSSFAHRGRAARHGRAGRHPTPSPPEFVPCLSLTSSFAPLAARNLTMSSEA